MCVDSTKFPSKCLYINPDTLLCDICIFSYRRIMGGYCIPDDTPLTGNGIERCARAFLTVCIQCEKGSALLNGVCGSLTI